jgi:hypothetical protein
MGLFNSGKNDKVEKVNKYERHYNVPRHRSLKQRSNQAEPSAHRTDVAGAGAGAGSANGGASRALSQPPVMRMGPANGCPSAAMFPSNAFSAARYGVPPFDMSKYSRPTAFPFVSAPTNFAAQWNYPPVQPYPHPGARSAFAPPPTDYVYSPLSALPPSINPYFAAMHF